MQLSIGPYIILGRLHVDPGMDPMKSVLQREPMIPLTSATIAYSVAGAVEARDVDDGHRQPPAGRVDHRHRRRGLDLPRGDGPLAVHAQPAQGLHRPGDALADGRRPGAQVRAAIRAGGSTRSAPPPVRPAPRPSVDTR